ncbi:hypothetical protein ACHAW5_003489 [Stephanodiscus triporus]|uniref:Crossover junction endonuclease MUS81 n=1 Tax=Stephanodiscus triporus TaxID=2934178 RepID=A0ABD3NKL7_9STRA
MMSHAPRPADRARQQGGGGATQRRSRHTKKEQLSSEKRTCVRSMEVITIDSSDDEEAASEIDGKERIIMASTLLDILNTQSDDDNSSTSSGDIWKTIGLSSRAKKDDGLLSRAKKDDSDAENDALIKNFKGSCIISTSEVAKELQQAARFEESSVSSADCGFIGDRCVSAPSQKPKETQFIPLSDSDESSISSADSIWEKVGLPSRSKVNGAVAPRRNIPINTGNDLELSVNLSAPKSDTLGGKWKVMLLMDHREFGCANNFLSTVEKRINRHFGGHFAEITTLPSADYMFVSRLISNSTGEVMDERVLDLVIERKNVQDVCQCLIADSKKYKPLSFFEAQMYKLQNCGVSEKLFLMEGDEDKAKNIFAGAKSNMEKERRLKRVKTLRLQLENGEFQGIGLICTRNRHDTVTFLIQQLESFQKSFNPMQPPTKTREQLKLHINEKMNAPTFLEYLRLRSQPGIGDVKAMKVGQRHICLFAPLSRNNKIVNFIIPCQVIMDPTLDWDKSFVSPSSNKMTKASLSDRATFWPVTSINAKDRICINPYRSTSKQPSGGIKKASKSY